MHHPRFDGHRRPNARRKKVIACLPSGAAIGASFKTVTRKALLKGSIPNQTNPKENPGIPAGIDPTA
jgi:hypothetical protein